MLPRQKLEGLTRRHAELEQLLCEPAVLTDIKRLNALNRVLVATHPRTRLIPFAELISEPDGSVSADLRPDGMHLDPGKVPALL